MFVAVSAENAIFVTVELDLVLDCTLEIDVNKNLAVGSYARDHTTSANHSGAEVDGIAPESGDAFFLHVLPSFPPGTVDTDRVFSGHFEGHLDTSWIVARSCAHLPEFTVMYELEHFRAFFVLQFANPLEVVFSYFEGVLEVVVLENIVKVQEARLVRLKAHHSMAEDSSERSGQLMILL